LQVPVANGVSGIASTIDDLVLDGRSWRAELGNAALRADLERTTEGASTITIQVHDGDGSLLRSPLFQNTYDVDLDGLAFRSRKARRVDKTTLELTLEARNAVRLRVAKGARKAKAGTSTRAAFGLRLVREVKAPPIPFYSPQLMVPVRLADQRDVRSNTAGKNVRREPGLPPGFKGTVKGVAADQGQANVIETVLDVGMALKAARKALLSAVLTVIVESEARNLGYGDRDSVGAFQQRRSMGWPASQDVARDARAYYKGIPGHPGAIGVLKANPSIKPGDLAQKVQVSGTPTAYQQWIEEGNAWVDAYLKGRQAGGGTNSGGKAQAALERQKKETTWDALGRLAEEVNWLRFEAADVVYFMAQTDLLGSAGRMTIEDNTPGITGLTFDDDDGKAVTQVDLQAEVGKWGCPPGTVANLGASLGPAAGDFIVTSIRTPVSENHPLCDVTLNRPTAPKPEPKGDGKGGKKKGKKVVRSSATTSGADRMVKWAASQVGVTEGSSQQRTYANSLGYSPGLPWCSLFIAYGLKNECGFKNLPGNPAHSSGWLSWSGGQKVSSSSLQPGDIVVFDWGDGGETDHVALFVGDGMVIGGNQSNRVSKVPLNRGAIVGCVRPNYG
jgi:hypothetical protein